MNNNKNITLISNLYPSYKYPAFGVFVKRMQNLVEKNSDINFDIIVIDIKTNKLIIKISNYFNFYFNIIHGFFKLNNDVLYLHFPITYAWLINTLLLFKNKKLILNLHGGDLLFTSKLYKTLNYFLIELYKKCSYIVVPSLYFKMVLIEKYPFIQDQKVIIIPSGGIDNNIFYKVETKINEKFHIGFVSRLEEGKGWLEYLKIINNLINVIEFEATIVGYGNDYSKVGDTINEMNLQNHIKQIGFLDNTDLADYFRKIDLLIIPTQLPESLCLVAIEALACGTPVLASNIGAIPEFIIEGYNGFLVNSTDIKTFSDKVISYSNFDYDKRNILNINCANSVLKFENNKSILPLVNIIKELNE